MLLTLVFTIIIVKVHFIPEGNMGNVGLKLKIMDVCKLKTYLFFNYLHYKDDSPYIIYILQEINSLFPSFISERCGTGYFNGIMGFHYNHMTFTFVIQNMLITFILIKA